LEIISETEKQLKTAKNPSTWLTAALLQFNSTGETIYPSNTFISKSPAHIAQNTGSEKLLCGPASIL
jgi:hypothetical protein